MAISARLSRTIHRTMGDEAGEDLINWMGQVESNRSELRELMESWAARTDGRFDALIAKTDGRFDALIARTDARFESIDSRFDAMDSRFDAMDSRFDAIDSRFGTTDARFDTLIAKMDARFDAMIATIDARFAEQRHWVELRFAETDDRFARVETRIEERFSDVLKWSIAFWLGGIGAMAALIRLMR